MPFLNWNETMKDKKNLKKIQAILTKDENIEKDFNLKGCHVYATNKRLVELRGRTIRDYDYAHISSIAYTPKRYWRLIVFGLIIMIAGIYFGSNIDDVIIWASVGAGFLFIILGVFKKTERVEVNVVGVPEPVRYKGERVVLDSLLHIVRQKRLTEPVTDKKETKDTDFVETIRKLAELRDDGILTQEEFEEKKSKILRNSD